MKIPNYFNRLGISAIDNSDSDEVLQTPNDLTSNDSNSDFIVSQRTTSGNQEAWKAMDGNFDTYSRTLRQVNIFDWWQIEFKTPVQLQYIYLNCNNRSSKNCYLEYSNDGITWYKLDTTAFNGYGITERQYINLSVVAKYYRVICQAVYYYIQIYEIKFKYKKVNNFINATDQSIKFKLNEYNEYQIEYENTSTNNATFKVIEGQLPEGIYLDQNTGLLHGQPTENVLSSFKIRISNKIKYVDIILTIEANSYLVTPHNLTSYSNDDFTVSQNSNADYTRLAWKAMDGSNNNSERDCAVTGKGYGNWWQIKFNNNVTIKKLIFTARKNTVDETQTVNSKDLVLQYSSDGSNFYDVVYFEVNLKSQAETIVNIQDNNNYVQYWRIKDTDTELTHHLIIGELQFTYEKYPYDITTYNQNIFFKLNEYNSIPIKYESNSKVSFEIIEGTLPEGIEFDAINGIFYGTGLSEASENIIVKISNEFNSVQITIKLVISNTQIIDPIISDNLTFLHSFSNSVLTPEIGNDLSLAGTMPILEEINGIKCCTLQAQQALYSENANYWIINPGMATISVSVWVLFNSSASDNMNLVFTGQHISISEGLGISFQFNSSDQIKFEYGGHWNSTMAAAEYNKWYHLAYTGNPDECKCYLNGNLKGNSIRSYSQVNIPFLGINCSKQNATINLQDFSFSIARLRIYDRTLTPEQIQILAQEFN